MKKKSNLFTKKRIYWMLWIFLVLGIVFACFYATAIFYQWVWAQWFFFGLLLASLLVTGVLAFSVYRAFEGEQKEAVTSLGKQISSFRGGSLPLLSLPSRKFKAFLPLQEAINGLLENYSRFEIVSSHTSQDKTIRDQIALGHVFRDEEFRKNLFFELQGTYSSRSALLMFQLISKKSDPAKEKEALLKEIRATFPEAMLGEREDGFSCFVYGVGALLALQTTCERLVQNFCAMDFSEGESLSYCKAGGAIYPFVSMSELYGEAEKALSQSDGVKIVSDLGRFYFPRSVLTENNKLVIYEGFLETSRAHYHALNSRPEKIALLSDLFVWAASTLGLDSGGYLLYDPSFREYRVEMDVGRNGKNLGFGKLGSRIESSLLDPFYEQASSDLHFAVNDVDKLPSDLSSFLRNLGMESVFLRSVGESGKKGALLFLQGQKKVDFDSLIVHSMLDSFSSLVSDILVEMGEEKELEGAYQLLDALSSRSRRFLYTIDRSSHRLCFVSEDLRRIYPEARPGEICYKAFHRGEETPCSYCPLSKGTCTRTFQEVSASPITYCVLQYRGADSDRSTLLMEPEILEGPSFKTSRLFDETFMIRNQKSLSLAVERDCKSRNPGYVLAARINNIPALIAALPESDLTSLLGQVVKNFLDAGYGELAYRVDETTLAFLLPSYTKTKAISFAEEVAEIFAIPLEAGNVAKLSSVSYALIAYPGDVSNARQMLTLIDNDMKRSASLGEGMLVDQSGAAPRKALRSEFITALLHEAIGKEKMHTFLQPIVDARTLRPITGDIRAALYAPDKSEVAPAEFIPLAEKAGLVSKIDVSSFRAMGELFSQYGYSVFKNVGVLHLAIYLSLDSLSDSSFPRAVKRAFSQYHFPKDCVQFEIKTEYLSKNSQAVKALQEALSSVSIEWIASEFNHERDDLSLLGEFSIKTVKTDRLVVSNALSSARDGTSFARFCSDAQKAGINVIATGIETEEQSKFVSHLGIYAMEGYYFGRPMNEADFIKFVAYGSVSQRR